MTIGKDILQSVFALIDFTIDYMSKNLSQNPNSKRANTKSRYQILTRDPKGITTSRTPEELLQNLMKILKFVGVHIGLNPVIFQKVIQVFNVNVMQSNNLADNVR